MINLSSSNLPLEQSLGQLAPYILKLINYSWTQFQSDSGFGSCVSSLILSETLFILFSSCLEGRIHVVCMSLHLQLSVGWGRGGG